MTKTVLALTIVFLAVSFLRAQETSPSSSPSATPARSVRISFVPPPLEGKISLGVYSEWGQLLRVLHQEAEFHEFAIGADALSTKWDGKDDYEYDLPAGKYSARGFLVAPMKIGAEAITSSPGASGASSVRIKLIANPLENNERPSVDITAGFDDDDVYLQTIDGLPLVTVAKRQDGANVRQIEVSGIAKMMAFDCGTFELK